MLGNPELRCYLLFAVTLYNQVEVLLLAAGERGRAAMPDGRRICVRPRNDRTQPAAFGEDPINTGGLNRRTPNTDTKREEPVYESAVRERRYCDDDC
jgi:hypothetical protein